MLTQVVLGRTYDFSHVVGRLGGTGDGFTTPYNVVIAKDDIVYILNRGGEGRPGGPPLVPNGTGARVGKWRIGKEPGDEEFLTEFGGSGEGNKVGDGPGGVIWAVGLALDSQENVYVTDEWLNRITAFDKDGKLLGLWGTPGEGDGELNRPSGVAVDKEDNLYIVDSLNHRVQKFTRDGKYLAKWGSLGSGKGEFNSPWGITIDHEGNVYVADHKNHRVQKFTPEGQYLMEFGSHGTGPGELNRPSDVAVDPEGDVYICDWANNRVQIYTDEGKFITTLRGDAQELSKSAKVEVESNLDVVKARRLVKSLEPEWRFALPTGLAFDPTHERLIVTDSQRLRVQVYSKVKNYMAPQVQL